MSWVSLKLCLLHVIIYTNCSSLVSKKVSLRRGKPSKSWNPLANISYPKLRDDSISYVVFILFYQLMAAILYSSMKETPKHWQKRVDRQSNKYIFSTYSFNKPSFVPGMKTLAYVNIEAYRVFLLLLHLLHFIGWRQPSMYSDIKRCLHNGKY